nr:MAG TPA: hypothetical protein [Caudoviricetes sp.]
MTGFNHFLISRLFILELKVSFEDGTISLPTTLRLGIRNSWGKLLFVYSFP